MWWWVGFERIPSRVNQCTGEVIKIDPPIWLHHEDADWFFGSWDEIDLLEARIGRAMIQAAA